MRKRGGSVLGRGFRGCSGSAHGFFPDGQPDNRSAGKAKTPGDRTIRQSFMPVVAMPSTKYFWKTV